MCDSVFTSQVLDELLNTCRALETAQALTHEDYTPLHRFVAQNEPPAVRGTMGHHRNQEDEGRTVQLLRVGGGATETAHKHEGY